MLRTKRYSAAMFRLRTCIRAALLGAALTIGSAGVVHAQPADPAKLEQAKQHMAAGSAFYNDPSGKKCEEAAREFKKAYELSGSWKALRALAICELELERDGDAIDHYEEVLKIGGSQIDALHDAQIERDLTAPKTAAAESTIRTNRPATRLIATRQPSKGLPIINRYTVNLDGSTLRIHPGQYSFTAQSEGFPDITWTAEVQNGGKYNRQLEFQEAPAQPPPGGGTGPGPGPGPEPKPVAMERPVPVTLWIFTGVTVACAGVAGTFMGLSTVAKSDYDEANGTASRAELEEMRDDVITKSIVADVFIGATAASLGATLIFYFTRPEVAVEAETAGFTVSPIVGPDGAFLSAPGAG